ncbi:ATP-dependent helicase [Achromobacter aegrifaciens]|uniref:DNA 3'-5' helicase n=1 Tax=Achromobacter aegrifaciens TaxID=1287736 RepID=A0ABU2DAR7_ACHAE|nr:ATP-dependent helicase [Achromobacter aegrifaciens]MDR7945193.1 ATP-dependent helicase [Achromobacter aegrifaciens]
MTSTAPPYLRAAEDLRGNEDQWRAYQSTGNCVILAGPGSGKTKTITVKIARMLTEDVHRPRRLACITYSNACVGELRSRLNKLGADDGDRLLLSTVHSFCLTELVSPYAALAGIDVPDPLIVASPAQARKYFADAYREQLGGNVPNWFRMACDKLRRTIPDKGSDEWRAWSARETAVVEAYEALLLQNGLIDFDGLILAGLQLVEKHEWVRCAIQAKYPVVVIDEYQDLGLPLHRIVLALLRMGTRIVAVGDPDQSIYGFTGAKPSLLRALARLPRIESIRLKMNYRCADRIIAASMALLPEPAEFRSHDGRAGEILIHRLERNIREQADYALGTLVPALLASNPSWTPGDIALLYRSLNEGTPIAQAADALDLRYFRLDNGSPIKRTRLTEWLTDAARWCAGGWQTGTVPLSLLLKAWRRLRRSIPRDSELLSARKRLIAALFSLRDGALPLHRWLSALRREVLDELLQQEPGLADEKDNLDELMRAAAEGGPLQAFTVEIFGNQGKSPDQINLMTLHSSKGLEFQAVIMVGLENGVFPSSYDKTDEQLAEAARLFYVGVTRAKTQIHLTYDEDESPLITSIREAG